MPNSVNQIKDWIKSWTEDAKKLAAEAERLKIWGEISSLIDSST